MPSRAMREDGKPVSSWPAKTTVPRRSGRIPITAFKVVVLPAPLRPSKVTTSPSATAKPTPCKTCDSPYQAWRSRTASSGAAGARAWRATSSMAAAEIGFAHVGIAGDGAVVALGQHLAAHQHGDGVRQIGDDGEIMLDHEDGARPGDLADERRDVPDILAPEPGHRLVEQQQFGIERQGGRDLERALAAIGQLNRR